VISGGNMKITEKRRKEAELTLAKIRSITRHIRNVEDNCLILGEKLITQGDIELGKKLIAHGFVHDASKFHGIEFEYLSLNNPTEENNKLKMKMAIQQHNTTNLHHAEAWGQIKNMPDVYLAELVCDIKARSEEFGTSLMDYINNTGIKRWGIEKDDETYKKIIGFVDLLCEQPFKEIK
jgi:Family of unknown function (DUF5662)